MKILKKLFRGNTLFYPGCLTKFVLKDIEENYKKIFEREGIEFIVLKEKEFCCGSPLKNAGAEKDFKEIAERNFKVFKEHGVDRIITNCPACAAVFRIDYKKILGDKWDIEVFHVTEVIQKIKRTGPLVGDTELTHQNIQDTNNIATYHDPCHLGRALGIYDQPREIIKKAGYEIKEMTLTREKAYCCGGGGGVKSNNAELANKIAQDRIGQAKDVRAETLITSCPMCYANLKENGKDLDVRELSEII